MRQSWHILTLMLVVCAVSWRLHALQLCARRGVVGRSRRHVSHIVGLATACGELFALSVFCRLLRHLQVRLALCMRVFASAFVSGPSGPPYLVGILMASVLAIERSAMVCAGGRDFLFGCGAVWACHVVRIVGLAFSALSRSLSFWHAVSL